MDSLVTRCPQCRAAFRVVAEQLRLRDGKVRCGVCHTVFNARAHQEGRTEPVVPPLQPVQPVPLVQPVPPVQPVRSSVASAPPPAAPVRPRPPAEVRQEASTQGARRAEPTTSQVPPAFSEPWLPDEAVVRPLPASSRRGREPVLGAASPPPATRVAHKREPVLTSGSAPAPTSSPGAVDRMGHGMRQHVAHHVSDIPVDDDDGFGPASASHADDRHHVPPYLARHASVSHHHETHRELPRSVAGVGFEREDAHEADAFVAHGTRSGYGAGVYGRGHNGIARVFWSVACMLAGLALVLQALWWWRTPIATHVPAMRPIYDAVCAGMGCRVGYVRLPDQLSIVSSSIQPQALSQPSDKGQHLILSTVLRNRASHAQPWPAIELTLTDFADVVVVRRAVSPDEYLGPGAPEFFPGNSEREIAVSLTARGAPVSGYRLALFFP